MFLCFRKFYHFFIILHSKIVHFYVIKMNINFVRKHMSCDRNLHLAIPQKFTKLRMRIYKKLYTGQTVKIKIVEKIF